MIPSFINKELIPHKPGVYLFKNKSNQIIYVGKAIDLHSRVSSYFSGPHIARTRQLVSEICDLETIIVESELEALILEANLIKTHLPLYNVKLTDDKDYLYIKITKEDFPTVITARKHELKNSLDYFGPFPSSNTVRSTLKRLRKIFPWCSNPYGVRNKLRKPCFYRHLGLCPGACRGEISKEDYSKIIQRLRRFLKGESKEVINELTKDMEYLASKQDFEDAANYKKIIAGILYLLQPNQTKAYLENPNFLEDQRQVALESLQRDLKLSKLPERIECFDISNTQGTNSTGSMVVLTNGEIDKSQYRRFKIQISGRPNDVGMHQEMMRRRLKHKEWLTPDLILIDGGRGQARIAESEIKKLGLNIPVYGIAKRLEWLYHPNKEIVKLPKSSLSIKLIQKIRDEAHRFALNYHRKLRSNAMILR